MTSGEPLTDSPDRILNADEAAFPSPEEAAPHLSPSHGSDAEAQAETWREATDEELSQVLLRDSGEHEWPHEWHTLCWLLASGLSQREAARELNYTESRISIICAKPTVQNKIERIKKTHWDAQIGTRIGQLAPRALDVFEQTLGDRTAKLSDRIHAAQWLLEKHSGKPRQDVGLDAGAGFLQLLQALEAAKEKTVEQKARETIDVTPERDPLADWVSQNVPVLGSEKAE